MCGISGFCDFNKKSSLKIVKNMTDVLYYRGPDDSGYSFHEFDNVQIGLGHRRLSIIDLTKNGHQPMIFDNLEIIFNGEIYNFLEIKNELLKERYIFESGSDTEVILKAYHKWGIKSIDKFNGMFSIVILDKKEKKLILIRDRAGVKPFYYYSANNLILFASELKSFHSHKDFNKDINKNSLALYMQFGYIPEPYSIFKNTYKLKAGHYIEISLKSKEIKEIKYWDVADFYNKPKIRISEQEAITEIHSLLKSSFEYRMIADVPIGVFLSGGIDSSLVASILQNNRKEKINTFTIGFNEKEFNEATYAKKISKHINTNHTEYYCTEKDALDIIPKLSEIYDEPFGDTSSIPNILVSRLAKRNVSVSLSADGGDEIFAGYNKYDISMQYYNKFLSMPNSIKNTIKLLMDNIDPNKIPFFNNLYNFSARYNKINSILKSDNIIETMKYVSEYYTKNERKLFLKFSEEKLETNFDIKLSRTNDILNQMLCIDYKTYMLDNILTKVDRATMSIGLEGREPFMDYRIIEFVSQIDSSLKYKNNDKKWLLKEIAYKYIPKELLDRPKQGFSPPLFNWLKSELKNYLLIYLDKKRIDRHGFFNSKEVLKLRDDYLKGKNISIQKLWFLLIFEMWYEKWM